MELVQRAPRYEIKIAHRKRFSSGFPAMKSRLHIERCLSNAPGNSDLRTLRKCSCRNVHVQPRSSVAIILTSSKRSALARGIEACNSDSGAFATMSRMVRVVISALSSGHVL